jgi:hypothetical protein
VEGWSKIVAGVVLGVAGTVYATNEEVRKRLPRSARRREEILRDLAEHEAQQDRLARQAREETAVRRAEEEASQTTQRTEEGSA